MRLSVYLLIFLILFNGWAGLLQTYDIDDHLGISAETGDPAALENATSTAQDASDLDSGGLFDSLIGIVQSGFNAFTGILVGIQPGAQMLANIVPPGPAESLVEWGFSIVPIIIGIDVLAYARGQGGF